MKNLLDRICDPNLEGRDLLVDELNDLIMGGQVTQNDQEKLAQGILNQIEHENNAAVKESIFNLLGTIFGNGISTSLIADGVAKNLTDMPVGCLVHAIPIIADSSRLDKVKLLSPFLESNNLAIKYIVRKYHG